MLKSKRILLVEDSADQLELLDSLLRQLGASVKAVRSIRDAREAILSESFAFMLSDLHLESRVGAEAPDGLELISFMRSQQPHAVIVASSSDPRAAIWNEALRAGAQNFVRKPLLRPDELIIAFGLAKERQLLRGSVASATQPSSRWSHFFAAYPEGLVVEAGILKRAKGLARYPDKCCTIVGETGTGKEEIARLIHRYRCQAEGQIPFVAVNCATISPSIAESLLFGHRKGAFTGAEQTTVGYVGEADGGILFLDEIHTLEHSVQQKLLRVLNDGSYNRLGETKLYRSQFQLLAASTRDLDDAVDEGRFLLDLRSRLMGFEIHLKPLRERMEDLPAFLALFFARKNISISDDTFEELRAFLASFHWRGNIRELFKALESWVLNCEFDELPLEVKYFPIFKGMRRVEGATSSPAASGSPNYDANRAFFEDRPLEKTVDEYERRVIEAALRRHPSIAETALALETPRSTLDAKRRKYNLLELGRSQTGF